MRLPWVAVLAGGVAVALGAAGLVRAAVPIGAGQDDAPGAVTVSGAYVRAPVPPTQIAAAYFTVTNATDHADRLTSVSTGAGATSMLHSGSMTALTRGSAIPAHGRLVLTTGGTHVMIEQLFGPVRAGQTVDIQLTFRTAGIVDVVAPVIAVGATPPTQAGAAQSGPSSTGVHS